MRTTVVVRGGEWLASAPIHYELFHVLGFKMPKYAHTAHLMKFDEETGGKRKLSKRKDPELSLDYYRKDGYHPYTMKVYLMTLLNSNFEEWHEKFPDKDINEFPFSLDKMSTSGALFDKDKLHNICKNELSKLSEDELYDFLYDWAEENEPEKKNIWFADKEKMLGILRLYMGIGMKRRRKDFMYAKQIFEMIGYFFDMEDTQEKDEFRMDTEDVKTLKSSKSKVKVLVLTVHNEVEYLMKAVDIGVDGYILKDSESAELKKAIFSIVEGENYIQPSLIPSLNSKMIEKNRDEGKIESLTKRELEVLRLLAVGMYNKEVAEKLNISERTVKNHVSNIFKKIEVTDRTQAAVFAIRNNLIEL